MSRSHQHVAARRPAVRRGLACALAAAVLLPQASAIASSGAPSAGRSPSSPAAAAGRGLEASAQRGHHRKPITVKVSPQLFGVHDTTLTSLSHRGIGALRLWDAGTTWGDLEPQKGVWDFGRLDQIVELAHADHTEVTLVLAGTPAWAAASPQATTWVDPPKVAAYKTFVTTVMKRYKRFDPARTGHGYRGIANYQVWNEPNIKTYWTGTQPQMATLVHTAWQVRQQVDKGAKIIGPSMVTRLPYELKSIGKFYSLKVAHKPVWKFVDATTFSLYPVDVVHGRPAGPEEMINLVHATRQTLTKAHVPARLPMWDSEVNYGLPSGSNVGKPTPPITGSRQAAYVMRTYLLSAAAGLPRVFWYRYDYPGDFVNTFLTAPAPAPAGTLTAAGQAFFRIQRWMKGTLVGTATKRPCAADKHGTYTCVVKYGKGVGRIYWNPRHTEKVKTAASSKSWQSELGAVHRLKHGARLKVGYAPVLVLSKH